MDNKTQIKTKRSSERNILHNKENKEEEISVFERSGKGRVSIKKTPLRSRIFNSKTASAVKRQSLNQTYIDERLLISCETIERMKN